ncbi:hypothetical protein R1flu_009676 [Riccia fluitans]|uniref:C3H1-type domain-containing protein n=1 Tax=Riccia fluitans TaxID=41844 RepID=A0ABD1Z2T3_9MARC
MDPYGPPRKRPRADASLNGNGNGHAAVGSPEMECRRFNTPEGCPYGDACRFRHISGPPSGPISVSTSPIPPEKETSSGGGGANRTKPCTKFFSTSGCPYGEGCHFLHYVPGGVASLGISPLPSLGASGAIGSGGGGGSGGSGGGNVRKVLGGVGPAGIPAPLSPSDQGSNLGGFKTRLCNRYDTPEGCRFGEKCHFAHGEKELRKSNLPERDSLTEYPRSRGPAPSSSGGVYRPNSGAGGGIFPPEGRFGGGGGTGGRDGIRPHGLREPTPPGLAAAASFGASSTAKISIEASLAGAIIGKGGVNAKQICRLTGAKLSIREHETDPTLRNVEMEGSFEQIKQASSMVRQVSFRPWCERTAGACNAGLTDGRLVNAVWNSRSASRNHLQEEKKELQEPEDVIFLRSDPNEPLTRLVRAGMIFPYNMLTLPVRAELREDKNLFSLYAAKQFTCNSNSFNWAKV